MSPGPPKVASATDPVPGSTAPEAWASLVRLASLAGRPLERFLHVEAASGVLLLLAAALALLAANSPWAEGWGGFWRTPLGIRVGPFAFERTLEWVVNDGLMAIFFFVVGLEIRREIHRGELSEWRRAALPAAAALGGVTAPALLYLLVAGASETRVGWGVPMATDIAFAVGVLGLLGKRVPAALRVLLLALAIIDDLVAILVIALFYSGGLSAASLLFAAVGFLGVFAMQRFGVRSKLAYIVPSVVAWAGIYAGGIHPTIAGVIVGLITPVRAWLGPSGFLDVAREQVARLEQRGAARIDTRELTVTLHHIDHARREAMAPSEALIHALHPWVAFVIMPVFALANAGVTLSSGAMDETSWRVLFAVGLGLVVGKPVGVVLASWLAIRLRVALLPIGLTVRHLWVLGVVAGVGFTMALFIAQLAFADARLLAGAKLGVLAASAVAGVLALLLGRFLLAPVTMPGAAQTADEAEQSTVA
ncbi:MAG: Na+/H+ antiporter NhaA [Deltaproteobacteria bacterium]|nr:Na+/H+ antiporter NhaA [Deltaproteobacteria bacterium]